jgi:hypothetical protein
VVVAASVAVASVDLVVVVPAAVVPAVDGKYDMRYVTK